MCDWGTVPQWVTAAIAGCAFMTALVSIKSQREIARRRAAADFFLKTEMDSVNLQSHKSYLAALGKLSSVVTSGQMDSSFATTDAYWAIRDYLNLHELMAVGIQHTVFDNDVCYDFWVSELLKAHDKAMPLIKYVQSVEGQSKTYTELCKVAVVWGRRRKKEL